MKNGSWLLLDVLSSLPIAMVEHLFAGDADVTYGVDHMLRFARVARLLNTSRLSRGIKAKNCLGFT